ncbi:MAG: hypothetical protein J7L55_04180 [Desulfurococcales archaeon]|nr:hypothetical protein [Desulfurococcales archaeon]
MFEPRDAVLVLWILLALVVGVVGLIIYRLKKVEEDLKLFKEALNGEALRAYLKGVEAREKRKFIKRYLVVKVPQNIKDRRQLQEILEDSIKKLYGPMYLSLINPQVIYFNLASGKAVIRFSNQFRWKLIASLSVTQKVVGGASIIPVKIAGTLKKAKRLAEK